MSKQGELSGVLAVFLTVILIASIFVWVVPTMVWAISAPPEEEWNVTFGGMEDDFGNSVQETSDGGYIITGKTSSFGAGKGDVWLIKTDPNGTEQWNNTFGGMEDDFGNSVQETSDGGYIISGGTRSYGSGNTSVWLIKTDSGGIENWSKTFGGSDNDWGSSVQETSDKGYIITGRTMSFGAGNGDVWLIKTYQNGTEQWNMTFNGPNYDYGFSVQETSDGGYIVSGGTWSYGSGGEDVWLIKTDLNGTEEWNNTFDGSFNDYGFSVQETSDGYIIIGKTMPYSYNTSDAWLIKTDLDGNKQWAKTFGGPGDDWGYSVNVTSDGGYIISGRTSSFGSGNDDVWLIKTDLDGNEQWNKTFGGSDYDRGDSIWQTLDGGYIISGRTSSFGSGNYDAWLIKVKGEGIENLSPNASFTNTPEKPFVNQTTTFNASNSTDSDGTILSYEWNFDDGNTTITQEPIINHSYNSSGNYTVNLTVTDDDGATNSTGKEITIRETPALTTIAVIPDNVSLNVTETQQFNATGYDQYNESMENITFNWSSSDDSIGTVDQDGNFLAIAPGSTLINATNGSVNGSVRVTVAEPTPSPTPSPSPTPTPTPEIGVSGVRVIDTDKDGWQDIYERFMTGTDPYKWDTDGDGISDPEDPYPLDPTLPKKPSEELKEGVTPTPTPTPTPEVTPEPTETPTQTPPVEEPPLIPWSWIIAIIVVLSAVLLLWVYFSGRGTEE